MMKKLILLIFLLCASPVFAATYYVNPSRPDDTGACTSNATACRTIEGGLAKMTSAGDDLYILAGSTYVSSGSSKYYTVPVSGASAGNPTVIGAYYMNNDVPPVETVGVPAGGQKPILDGNHVAPSTSSSRALIYATDKDYVIIQDLSVKNSACGGIWFTNGSTYNTVQRCYVEDSFSSGIMVQSSSYNTLTLNEVYKTLYTVITSSGFPAGMNIIGDGADNNTATYNTIHGCRYECFDVGGNGSNNTIEYNTIYDFGTKGIYVCWFGENNIVRNNLVYGVTTASSVNSYSQWEGISVTDEDYAYTLVHPQSGHKIYNNVVAGCSGSGFRIGSSYFADRTMSDISFFSNTSIDNGSNGVEANFMITGDYTKYSNVLFQNNLSLCISSPCKHYAAIWTTGGVVGTGIDWDYNQWAGGTAPTGEPVGAHDITDTPSLVKMTGYRSLTPGGLLFSDVKHTVITSAGVDDGATLGAPYNVDAFGTSRPVGSGYDIGAHEWPATGTPTCGDTICDPATETCVSCEADCGACASGSFSCTDVSLIWDMEAEGTIQYTLGADTAFTLNSAAINADANKAGTNGLDCPTPNDNAQLTLADGLVVSRLEGSVAFWIRLYAAPSNGATLWYAGTSGSSIYITFVTGGNVALTIYNGSYVSLQTTGAGMTATGNPWYFVIARWDHANNDRWVGVYNSSGVLLGTAGENLTTSWTAPPSEFTNMYLGNTNSASTFDVHFDYLLGISKKYDTDWLSIDTEAKPDCSGEEPVSLALTEVAYPTVPLTGVATWSFNSTLAGTLAMSGPCYTETTTVSGGVNNITFRKLGKGIYSNCVASVTDGDSNVVALSMSPFTVDGWNLERVESGGFALSPASSGGFALTPVE